MSQVVIKVEDLSKAYQIGQIGTGTLSRDLERFWVTKVLRQEDPFLKIGETNDRSTNFLLIMAKPLALSAKTAQERVLYLNCFLALQVPRQAK